MARRSLKEQRAEEILNAFERCVVMYGVEGAGLQRVADEAGLTRSLLRHHVGNREELLEALVERFTRRGEEQAVEFDSYMPAQGRVTAMINMLFDPVYQSSSHDVVLYQALLVAAQTRPALKSVLLSWYDDYLEAMREELLKECPGREAAHIGAVAVGILALYFNADSMAPISRDKQLFAESKLAAQKLMETL